MERSLLVLVTEVSHDDILPLFDQVTRQLPQFLDLAHAVALDQRHQSLGLLDLLGIEVHLSEDLREAELDGQ